MTQTRTDYELELYYQRRRLTEVETERTKLINQIEALKLALDGRLCPLCLPALKRQTGHEGDHTPE